MARTPLPAVEVVRAQAPVEPQTPREIQVQDQQRRVPEARRIQQVQTSAIEQTEIQRRLERWKRVCVICRQAGQSTSHSISKCQSAKGKQANEERAHVQKTIRIQSNVACFKCGIPHEICNRWDDGFRLTNRDCQFFGILIGVVYGVKHAHPDIWAEWVQRARRRNVAVDSDAQIMSHLGSEAKGAGTESVQLLQAFIWMTTRLEG